jgi:hypothetical protein
MVAALHAKFGTAVCSPLSDPALDQPPSSAAAAAKRAKDAAVAEAEAARAAEEAALGDLSALHGKVRRTSHARPGSGHMPV